jgi:hypothetical protein
MMQTKSGWQNIAASANLLEMLTDQNSTIISLRGPVPLSHFLLQPIIKLGDCVIDATCGNGNDTLLLAELVGESGLVWTFDIQADAITKTISKLAGLGYGDRVRTIHAGHETMDQHVDRPVKAIIFNLGYLPGGDRNKITKPETTCSALKTSADLLIPGGVVLITIYPGHIGGADERVAVETWASELTAKEFHVWRMGQINVSSNAPYLLLIQKAAR